MVDRVLSIVEEKEGSLVDGDRSECVGQVAGDFHDELARNNMQPWRNIGLVFGARSQSTEISAASFVIGGLRVASVSGILDRLESTQDILDFASGLLARAPGPAAMNVLQSISGTGLPLEVQVKGRLLEQLLDLGTQF